MSTLSAEDQAKLEALEGFIRAARAGGNDVQVAELVAVDWPGTDGRVYYASTQADDTWPGLRDLLDALGGGPVEPRLNGGPFLDVMRDSGISDDSVSLNFWEPDHAISDLFETHGDGARVEIFFYFPQVDLLLSQWHGHLRPPEDADEENFTASAENGFMSVQLPLPRRAFFQTCQAVFGGLLRTQAEIDEHDCPWNLQLTEEERGGAPAVGVPGSELLPPCPRRTRADCVARLGDSRFWLAFDTGIASYPVGSRGVIATSRGNETRLKRPLRVIAGKRVVRDLDLLAYVVETGNPSHPERGSIKLLYAVAEGRNRSLRQPKARGALIGAQHFSVRLGTKGQPSTGFTVNANNYSSTGILNCVLQGDFRTVDPASIPVEITVEGLDDVRVYASDDPADFAEEYSQDRAWWLLHAYRHKRWGLGADVRRFVMPDFIDLSDWFAETITYRDKDGVSYTGPRSTFNAELIDRTAQQQINDICLAGRCTVPFPWEGRLRVFPLKKLSEDELAAAPVFTDDVNQSEFEPNIVRDEQTSKSTLTRSEVSDRELPNAIKVTFDNDQKANREEPLLFDDVEQQLRAGRAFGDTGRRAVEKPYGLLGVTGVGEASRLGVLLRDLGEFDEGGLVNNQRIRFQTFFTQALTLYKSKVIRVLSRSLTNRRTQAQKFEYFRVRSVRRLSSLLVEVSAQAYPVDYYAQTEDLAPGVPGGVIPVDPGPELNPGGPGGESPNPVVIDSVDARRDKILIRLGGL
ncbi:MAG: hypothetical protein LC795_15660 [Acidobacteria bacterium]|nr:hypothetical protein [Acidobacteriota bacterium]MCA1620712.1 hypothetical protein [Acidobacteriota bacterium]